MKKIRLTLLFLFPIMLIALALFFYRHIATGVFELIAFILSSNILLLYTLIMAVLVFKMLRKKLALMGIEITTIFQQKTISNFS
ncbi:MAG: hypothetical protein PSX81_08685 [bacterium]|nr:hypothetical protein [bacterium]